MLDYESDRVTYIAEASPRSERTAGLIKVGSSRKPENRVRSLGMCLLGTTVITEAVIRRLFSPFAVPESELRSRNLEHFREWFYDSPEIREFVQWVCAVHPVRPERTSGSLTVLRGRG